MERKKAGIILKVKIFTQPCIHERILNIILQVSLYLPDSCSLNPLASLFIEKH
jgi:hypothetical protein